MYGMNNKEGEREKINEGILFFKRHDERYNTL